MIARQSPGLCSLWQAELGRNIINGKTGKEHFGKIATMPLPWMMIASSIPYRNRLPLTALILAAKLFTP